MSRIGDQEHDKNTNNRHELTAIYLTAHCRAHLEAKKWNSPDTGDIIKISNIK